MRLSHIYLFHFNYFRPLAPINSLIQLNYYFATTKSTVAWDLNNIHGRMSSERERFIFLIICAHEAPTVVPLDLKKLDDKKGSVIALHQ
ncbi:unnamed protein product [Cuscuta epithymum]|uniref:Uncharacterized protein n=1 Tax=Cuscuta epithymum TaxID=186058 RepID=A0AAV0FHD3_9ASTE|nr:unnamed protein product [Cuscuta epithymum]